MALCPLRAHHLARVHLLTHSFIHSFNKSLLKAFHALGQTVVNKGLSPCLDGPPSNPGGRVTTDHSQRSSWPKGKWYQQRLTAGNGKVGDESVSYEGAGPHWSLRATLRTLDMPRWLTGGH